ncbi:MAG: TraR/DksA C4-type zinc finger protein [Phycisphaerales bacterium]|nr:TraR/DksA C4-type zinc finger protein [Phycisphaerales bacterium]
MAKKASTKKAASKKKATSKKRTKKSTAPRSAAKKSASKKKTAKKKTVKKAASKKKPSKKAATKKKTAKKTASKKKSSKKAASKKKVATKPARKKQSSAKSKSTNTSKKQTTAQDASTEPTTTRKRGRRTVMEAALAGEPDKQGYVIVNGRRVRRVSVSAVKTTTRKKSSKSDNSKSSSKPRRVAKSRLTESDLAEFRNLLLAKRREVLRALDSMETEALRSDSGEMSTMPIHMADVGSDAYEQDLMLGISASERERIREIDAALARIENGTYGICEISGKAIRKPRLRAKPWARMNIDSAREQERSGRYRR